jgi:tetratricopeptide (TPR) repeat protein
MLTRLSQRFDLLTSRRRDLPARHRTLRSAVEWSYQSLSAELQTFFCKLSVFRGGWTLEAAEQVCEEPEALDYLAQLRNRSLLAAEDVGIEMRYRLLETLREYAEEQLPAETRADQERLHADYYLHLAEQGESHMRDAQQVVWRERLDPEQENFRIALTRCQQGGDNERGLRLLCALTPFWEVRGENAEGLRWLAGFDLGSVDLSKATRAKSLFASGTLHGPYGSHEEALRWYERCLPLYRELGDKRAIAATLRHMAHAVNFMKKDTPQVLRILEEAQQLSQESGDREGVAETLEQMAGIRRDIGEGERAIALYEQSRALYRQLQHDFGVSHIQREMGYMLTQSGEFARSAALLEDALEHTRRLRNLPATAHNLWLLGRTQTLQEEFEAGKATLLECIALSREIGSRQLVVNAWSDLGIAEESRGHLEEAATYFDEALTACREIGSADSLIRPLWHVAHVALQRDDPVTAWRAALESLGYAQAMENLPYLLYGLELLAQIAFQDGQPERATVLMGAVTAGREANGIRPLAILRPRYPDFVALLETALGAEAFQEAWQRGRTETIEETIAVVTKDSG